MFGVLLPYIVSVVVGGHTQVTSHWRPESGVHKRQAVCKGRYI